MTPALLSRLPLTLTLSRKGRGDQRRRPTADLTLLDHRRRPTYGFTLLELLVAMTIAAVVAGSLFAGLRIAFRAQESAEAAVEPARTAELAMSLLRPDFESAVPPTAVAADAATTAGVLQGAFLATDSTGTDGLPADTVEFHTLGDPLDAGADDWAQKDGMNGGLAAGGVPSAFSGRSNPGLGGASAAQPGGEVRLVQIGLVPYAGGQALVRRVTTNLLADVVEEPRQEIVCRGVLSLNFRYFDGLEWQDTWDSTTIENNIPAAIEVTMELVRGEDDRRRIIQTVRVFRPSCSTLTATTLTELMNTPASGASGTGGTGGQTP